MFPDFKPLLEEQRRGLNIMLGRALIDLRGLGYLGKAEQAHYLADTFHSLPFWLNGEDFSFSHFRNDYLEPYFRKYASQKDGYFNYLEILDKIEKGEIIDA